MNKRSVYKIAKENGYSIRKGNRHIYYNGNVTVVRDDKGNPVKGYWVKHFIMSRQ